MIQVMADRLPIGVRIARRRQALGMRQEDLARRLGVARVTVSNWESGKHPPKRKLGAIEEVLGVSLADEPEREPVIPPGLLAGISRWVPPDKQQEAIDKLGEILSAPTESGEGDPAGRPRRAS